MIALHELTFAESFKVKPWTLGREHEDLTHYLGIYHKYSTLIPCL